MATIDINVSSQIPNLTRVTLQALISGSDLSTQKWYVITNAVGSTKRIAVMALSASVLSEAAVNLTDDTFGTYDITTDTYTPTAGGSGVASVTGDSVDNTDPANPIVNAIPRAGTASGSPVTDFVQFSDDKGIYWTNGTLTISAYFQIGGRYRVVLEDGTNTTIYSLEQSSFNIQSDKPLYRGIEYNSDYSANFTLKSLINLEVLKKRLWTKAGAPTTSDDSTQGFIVGSLIWDTTNSILYRCTSNSVGAATWTTAITGGVTDGDKGDVVVSSSGTVWTVEALQTRPVSNTAPTTGQMLIWDGSAWTPTTFIDTGQQSNTMGDTVAASTSSFFGLSGINTDSTTESSRLTPMTFSGNAIGYVVITQSTQPASGSAVVTVRYDAADTPLTLTIAAGSAAGTFSVTATQAFISGKSFSVKVQNNATATSCIFAAHSMRWERTS